MQKGLTKYLNLSFFLIFLIFTLDFSVFRLSILKVSNVIILPHRKDK
jgi:hypothetical protein